MRTRKEIEEELHHRTPVGAGWTQGILERDIALIQTELLLDIRDALNKKEV